MHAIFKLFSYYFTLFNSLETGHSESLRTPYALILFLSYHFLNQPYSEGMLQILKFILNELINV